MGRRERHPAIRRRRALSRRRAVGAVFAAGALLTAPIALYQIGAGRELLAEAWLVAFVSCLVLAWIAEWR